MATMLDFFQRPRFCFHEAVLRIRLGVAGVNKFAKIVVESEIIQTLNELESTV